MNDAPAAVLTGPEIVPARVTHLVVLLHGYGSNGADLNTLARQINGQFPTTAFLSPNAPEPCPGNPAGFQWFGLTRISPEERDTGVYQAAPKLNEWLDRCLDRFQLDLHKLILAGFSQGAMMALHVGLRRPCAGILGFSGSLAAPGKLRDELHARPPVCLIHGSHDEVLPFPLMYEAKGALEANQVEVSVHLSHNVPHAIGPDGLQKAVAFLHRLIG
ncbi:MAG: alpha/beta hydrolase [Rhodothalassiaceae bacterium]